MAPIDFVAEVTGIQKTDSRYENAILELEDGEAAAKAERMPFVEISFTPIEKPVAGLKFTTHRLDLIFPLDQVPHVVLGDRFRVQFTPGGE